MITPLLLVLRIPELRIGTQQQPAGHSGAAVYSVLSRTQVAFFSRSFLPILLFPKPDQKSLGSKKVLCGFPWGPWGRSRLKPNIARSCRSE